MEGEAGAAARGRGGAARLAGREMTLQESCSQSLQAHFPPRRSGHGLRKHSFHPVLSPPSQKANANTLATLAAKVLLFLSQSIPPPECPGYGQSREHPRPPAPRLVSRLRLRGGRRGPPRESDGLFPVVVVEQFVLFTRPPLAPHPLGKYSAHVSSSLCPTSARHRGPRPPPPPPSSPLTVTSHNPERRGGGECPAPRSPPALHPIVFPPQCTPTHSSPPLLPLPPEVRPACPRPPPLTHTHTRVSWGRGSRGV